jgi:hypothetical protein
VLQTVHLYLNGLVFSIWGVLNKNMAIIFFVEELSRYLNFQKAAYIEPPQDFSLFDAQNVILLY